MQSHECFIYVLFDQDGSINYVGRSQNPQRRMGEHRKVLGFLPTYRVIDHCSDNCRNIEKHWIAHYRERGCILRNVAYGQGPHFLSAEGRRKLSAAFKGRPVTWAKKISDAQKGRARGWSEEGKKRVEATQLKTGHDLYSRLSPEARESHRRAAQSNWDTISAEERSRMATERNLNAWAKRSPKQRKQIGGKIGAALKARGSEWLTAQGKIGNRGLRAKYPDLQERARAGRAKFWASLTPEARANFLKKRAAAIVKAKNAKKLSLKLAPG